MGSQSALPVPDLWRPLPPKEESAWLSREMGMEMEDTTSPTTAIRTRLRPAPAAESITLRLGRDGGEDGRGVGGGFAEARAATGLVQFGKTCEKRHCSTFVFI